MAQPPDAHNNKMILTFYGDGKGKTSAALGVALRASGYSRKILFCQFIKGDWKTGEDIALKKIKNLTHRKFGIGFVLPQDDTKRKEEHIEAGGRGIKFVIKSAKQYDLIILDEILNAVKLKIIDIDDVLKIIKDNKKKDLILTGRPKIKKIIDVSDLVSEIKKIKHPFDKGIKAKKGIDY